MEKNGQHTGTFAGKLARRRLQKQYQWRTAVPSRDVEEALADFRDLCFRPPADPSEPHTASLAGHSPVAGEALAALEPLYDDDKMRQATKSGNFRDGADVVRSALAALLCIEKDPDRHLYKPLTTNDTPARNPGIALDQVVSRLLIAVQRDFPQEIEAIRRAGRPTSR
jgi:hypothetical protein